MLPWPESTRVHCDSLFSLDSLSHPFLLMQHGACSHNTACHEITPGEHKLLRALVTRAYLYFQGRAVYPLAFDSAAVHFEFDLHDRWTTELPVDAGGRRSAR